MPDLTPEERAEKAVLHRAVGMPSGATKEQIAYEMNRVNPMRAEQVVRVAAAIREAERRVAKRQREASSRIAFTLQAKEGRSDIGNAIQATPLVTEEP